MLIWLLPYAASRAGHAMTPSRLVMYLEREPSRHCMVPLRVTDVLSKKGAPTRHKFRAIRTAGGHCGPSLRACFRNQVQTVADRMAAQAGSKRDPSARPTSHLVLLAASALQETMPVTVNNYLRSSRTGGRRWGSINSQPLPELALAPTMQNANMSVT